MSQQHFLYDTNHGISVLALWSPGFGSFSGVGAVLGTLGGLAAALAGVEAGSIVGQGTLEPGRPRRGGRSPCPPAIEAVCLRERGCSFVHFLVHFTAVA